MIEIYLDMKKGFIYLGLFLMLCSCSSKQYTVSTMKGERLLVTSTSSPDPKMQSVVNEYKTRLDREMNVVIGTSDQDMPFGTPESLLTNLTADVMMLAKPSSFNGLTPDIAVMNVHGHRAPLAKGDITVGDIFEIYSFDNELAMTKLKGSDLTDLFKAYARMGGSGISSSVRLIITKNGELVSALVDGQPVDPDRVYNVITLDYLAEGNDGMDAFKKSISVYKPGIILRDYMMDYVKDQTSKGKTVSSKLDGRVTVQ